MEKICLEILGFYQRPSEKDLKKAYRSLVKKNHPDVTGGQVTQAYIEIDSAYKYLMGEITYQEAARNIFPNRVRMKKTRQNREQEWTPPGVKQAKTYTYGTWQSQSSQAGQSRTNKPSKFWDHIQNFFALIIHFFQEMKADIKFIFMDQRSPYGKISLLEKSVRFFYLLFKISCLMIGLWAIIKFSIIFLPIFYKLVLEEILKGLAGMILFYLVIKLFIFLDGDT